jgi:hypothetical protein
MNQEPHPFVVLRQSVRSAGTPFRKRTDNSSSLFFPTEGVVYAYDISKVEKALDDYEKGLAESFQEEYGTLTIEEKLIREAQMISTSNDEMAIRDFARTVSAYLVMNSDPAKKRNPLKLLRTDLEVEPDNLD